MAERLRGATSPYLLQHADNPVDWWQWGDEAFAEARRRDVPVLLSVGYSACHWCHVMAHESFEDAATAGLMNSRLVSIKVDREERPDVDAVYMTATQAMTGQGGWPMTVFMTPDREPFYCGTYYPREHFNRLVLAISQAWVENRGDVTGQAKQIAAALAESSERGSAGGTGGLGDAAGQNSAALGDAAVAALGRRYDARRGGYGGAPKFPPSTVLEFLLRRSERSPGLEPQSGAVGERALAMAAGTAEAMARGGIYDQLGGGFARYSVDADWVVPHFEKMLYDNAQLARVYAHWWRRLGWADLAASGDAAGAGPLFQQTPAVRNPDVSPDSALRALARRVAEQTCDWMIADLTTGEGGLASALDADSEGVEGAFYVWTPSELADVLGAEDGKYAAELFGVTAGGTFEHGRSVLRLLADPAGPDGWERYAAVRSRLLAARVERVWPGRDDKVVAAWNGLAIGALAEAGLLFGRSDYVEAARAAAELLARVHLGDGGRLARTSRDGVAGASAGVLEDYACVAAGFLSLAGVDGDGRWVRLAGELLDVALGGFRSDSGGFYDTASDSEQLIYRPADPADGPTPSGTFAIAGALLSYSALTGSARHREAAEGALGAVAAIAPKYPQAAGWGLAVAEAFLAGPAEIAIVGDLGDSRTTALHSAAALGAPPGAVLAIGSPDGAGASAAIPLLSGRGLVDGQPAAYVCRGFACRLPVTTPDDLLATFRQ
ncbi:MAG TPA: thioredoxin domain-containing protein [Streptosporangiaceae bacterium]|nr:thioredoxin domain-containing protein [Streptosporangiaceae bacterium]